ncbi:MAG: NADPH:quinone reductase [Capsulimonas sp.]|nr:NADPH:quinone reductase [Capsulimonas sp.]
MDENTQHNKPTQAKVAGSACPEVVEVVMPKITEPSGFLIRRRPCEEPGAGQVLVRVEATGVSFAEQSMRRGRYPGQPKFPFVPGYDLVGVVLRVGPGVSPTLVGARIAALTKTGGWTNLALLPAKEVMPIPNTVDAAEAEALVVNGVTAWQMLHRSARVKSGQTVLIHGANGGVGTILAQMAIEAGATVIGTAAPRHHDALRALGVEPLDYKDPNLLERIRRIAPDGVNAAFDPIGGKSAEISFQTLGRAGVLVSYGIAGELKGAGLVVIPFLKHVARLLWWSVVPNGRRTIFYNVWAGHTVQRGAFYNRLKEDYSRVVSLLQSGKLTPQIAARFPLEQAVAAMELAESRTAYGKVILIPD